MSLQQSLFVVQFVVHVLHSTCSSILWALRALLLDLQSSGCGVA